ncbi:MAG: hypothetical protein LBL65_02095 [Campylobacteraceae bacterium]|jgi:hypothetical protein|nr:hypothetical protein [Campylobacteraceae bacterium]
MRDYDKEPIVVKDYGVFFGVIRAGIIIFFLMIFILYNIFSIVFLDKNFNYIKICFEIAIVLFFLFTLVVIFPKEAAQRLSIFKFTNDRICYKEFKYNKNQNYTEIFDERLIYNKYIKQVSFCIVAEVWQRYGRKHYLSSWGLFKKSPIAIPLTKLLEFASYLLGYLPVLPIKIYKLTKAKEPLSLLKKNIVIEFTNRNYFLVNIYSQKEFDELMIYFKSKNISIQNKTAFLYHWQVLNKYFMYKEEAWCDEHEEKEV